MEILIIINKQFVPIELIIEIFEKIAKECSDRIKSGEYCIEDEVIDYAFTRLQNIESIINRYSTECDDCESGTMVVEIGRFEGFLTT